MAIRIEHTPITTISEAAKLAGQATAIKRAQDKAHQATLQAQQLAAASARQGVANVAAAERQKAGFEAQAKMAEINRKFAAGEKLSDREFQDMLQSRQLVSTENRQQAELEARAKAADLTRKFNAGQKLTDREHQLIRDAQDLQDQIKLREETVRIAAEEKQRIKQAERESRRQLAQWQVADVASIDRQIANAMQDPTLGDTQQEILDNLQARKQNIIENPAGEIPETAQERAEADLVILGGVQGYYDPQKKTFKEVGVTVQDRIKMNSEIIKATNDLIEKTKDFEGNATITFKDGFAQISATYAALFGGGQQQAQPTVTADPETQLRDFGMSDEDIAKALEAEGSIEAVLEIMRQEVGGAAQPTTAVPEPTTSPAGEETKEDFLAGTAAEPVATDKYNPWVKSSGSVLVNPNHQPTTEFSTWEELTNAQRNDAYKLYEKSFELTGGTKFLSRLERAISSKEVREGRLATAKRKREKGKLSKKDFTEKAKKDNDFLWQFFQTTNDKEEWNRVIIEKARVLSLGNQQIARQSGIPRFDKPF